MRYCILINENKNEILERLSPKNYDQHTAEGEYQYHRRVKNLFSSCWLVVGKPLKWLSVMRTLALAGNT